MFELTRSINFTKGVVQLIHPRYESDEYTRSLIDDTRGITRLKLHWWWLIDQVFDVILSSHSNPWVLFLEEDHIVSPDLLITSSHMVDAIHTRCRHCWGATLYAHHAPPKKDQLQKEMITELRGAAGWQQTAYMIDRRFYTAIKRHEDKFKQCRDGWSNQSQCKVHNRACHVFSLTLHCSLFVCLVCLPPLRDMSLIYLQSIGLLPVGHLHPRVSRVRNIGVSGLNVDSHRYVTLGLAEVRTVEQLFTMDDIKQAEWNKQEIEETEGHNTHTYVYTHADS